MSGQHIAVGMSGGIDSSTVAALLVEAGAKVEGFTVRMWRDGSRCCSLEDIVRAQSVCEFLGIPHHVLDAHDFFAERIVSPFVEEYVHGRTPSPCVNCNPLIKFGILLREALALGCSHLATGHYARLEQRADGFHLLKARDLTKDQSYFLHRLFQSQLAHSRFPLGDRLKRDVADYARQKKLPVRHGEESQDLCFIPEDGYAAFLEQRRPELKRPGPILDTSGREIGRHEGTHRFTIGQREGLGVASGGRLYVKEIRPESNAVIVGTREEVLSPSCRVEQVHWILHPAEDGTACRVRLRYRHAGAETVLYRRGDETVEAVFDEPQFAVTPGQAAVFYEGDEVLGGGWIAS